MNNDVMTPEPCANDLPCTALWSANSSYVRLSKKMV